MKKLIIIDEENNQKSKTKKRIDKLVEWLIYMVCYALVLITVSIIFNDSLIINNEYFGFYALLAAIIISVLNKTIKPILVYFTLPITALTLGLFYPVINVIILHITSFILGDKFQIKGILISFFIAILISIFNILVEGIIIKPLINKRRDYHG